MLPCSQVHQPGLGHPANKWPWPELISAAASSRSCPWQQRQVVMQGVIMVPAAWLKDPLLQDAYLLGHPLGVAIELPT